MNQPETARPTLSDAALAALRETLGDAHVCTDAAALSRHSACTIPWDSQCSAVVFPANAEEVAAVMRLANTHGLCVWPYSGGRNWGYGGTLAPNDGAVVMLLHRMNRVIEVNEELAYAVIEPGVTYEQLNHYLVEHGHRLWVDCIDGTSQGSVIGNALDRGLGETPYGDHFGHLCGMHVVLPEGDLVAVGGNTDGPRTFHLHKWGVGPYVEGMFTQSNFGVVVRAGIWLMPTPQAYNSYVFEVKDERHVGPVIDAFRRLALQGIVTTTMHMINDFTSLTVVAQRRDHPDLAGRQLDDAQLATLRARHGISPWSCAGGLYGTRAHVRLQRRILKRTLAPYGRLLFLSDPVVRVIEKVIATAWRSPLLQRVVEAAAGTTLQVLDSAPHVHRILRGVPTDYFVKHAYYRHQLRRPNQDIHPARDACGVLWFAPLVPFTSTEILPFLDRAKRRFAEHGLDFWVAVLMMNPRSATCLMNILYDKSSADESQRASALYQDLLHDMARHGYQQYRASLPSWPNLYDESPAMKALYARLKDAVDPKHVLAPGRYGID